MSYKSIYQNVTHYAAPSLPKCLVGFLVEQYDKAVNEKERERLAFRECLRDAESEYARGYRLKAQRRLVDMVQKSLREKEIINAARALNLAEKFGYKDEWNIRFSIFQSLKAQPLDDKLFAVISCAVGFDTDPKGFRSFAEGLIKVFGTEIALNMLRTERTVIMRGFDADQNRNDGSGS